MSSSVIAPDKASVASGADVQPRFRLVQWRLTLATWASWTIVALLVLVTVFAVVAPMLAPYDPVQPVGRPYQPILSDGHLLGTDAIGRDLASRVLDGVRTSWLMALVVTLVGLLIGATIGVIAGAFGGWLDGLLMRITDMFLALPATLVAIAVAAALGSGLMNTFWAITVVWWPYYARIIRGEVKALAARPHVEAARMAGVGRVRIMRKHLLPGVYPTALVMASLDIGNVVLTLASLSFLGLGAAAPAAELGADTSRGMGELLSHWWIPVVPGLTVMLLSLLANVGGDAVRNLVNGRR
ncbi:ABC transporter permease [Actinopolymorpha pittospori]